MLVPEGLVRMCVSACVSVHRRHRGRSVLLGRFDSCWNVQITLSVLLYIISEIARHVLAGLF